MGQEPRPPACMFNTRPGLISDQDETSWVYQQSPSDKQTRCRSPGELSGCNSISRYLGQELFTELQAQVNYYLSEPEEAKVLKAVWLIIKTHPTLRRACSISQASYECHSRNQDTCPPAAWRHCWQPNTAWCSMSSSLGGVPALQPSRDVLGIMQCTEQSEDVLRIRVHLSSSEALPSLFIKLGLNFPSYWISTNKGIYTFVLSPFFPFLFNFSSVSVAVSAWQHNH